MYCRGVLENNPRSAQCPLYPRKRTPSVREYTPYPSANLTAKSSVRSRARGGRSLNHAADLFDRDGHRARLHHLCAGKADCRKACRCQAGSAGAGATLRRQICAWIGRVLQRSVSASEGKADIALNVDYFLTRLCNTWWITLHAAAG